MTTRRINCHNLDAQRGLLALPGAAACLVFGCLCFEICERHFLHSRFRDESAAP